MVNHEGKPGKPGDLKIIEHGNSLRATVTIPLVVGKDDDIIEKLNGLPQEARQAALKNAIRGGMKLKAFVVPKAQVVDQTESLELLRFIAEKVKWLVEYFSPFHSYLEEKFAAIGTVAAVVSSPFSAKPKGRLTAEQIAERQKNTQEAEY